MAEETAVITPGGADAGAGAPTPAPESTSATVAQPSETSSTPAVTPTPTSDAGARPTRNPGESELAYLSRLHQYNDAQKAKPAEPAKADAPAEVPKVEEKKAEETPTEKPKEEEKPVANPLDEVGPLPVEKVAEALKANPELEKQLEAAGIGKDELFASLRAGAAMQQYQELFPGGIEDAQFAMQHAQAFSAVDDAVSSMKRGDMKSTAACIEAMMPLSFQLDEDGKPKLDANGRPITDGTVETMLENFRDLGFEDVKWRIGELAKSATDEATKQMAETLQVSIDNVLNFLNGNNPDEQELSEEIKAERAKIAADRQALADEKNKDAESKFEGWRASIKTERDQELGKRVDAILNATSLTDFAKEAAKAKIIQALFDRWESDKIFVARQEQIGRRGQNDKTKSALVAHYLNNADAVLKSVTAPILKAAGVEHLTKSEQRREKIATQTQASRMEPKGGGSAPALPKVQKIDEADLMRQARTNLLKGGREPDRLLVLQEFRRLAAEAAKQAV